MLGEMMRWNPADELSSWHRDIDDLFGRFFGRSESTPGNWSPRVETYRKENDYVIRVELPGVDPKDIHVQSEGNLLHIMGERKTEEDGSEYRRSEERRVGKECRYGWPACQ